jgi:hypothetical protein
LFSLHLLSPKAALPLAGCLEGSDHLLGKGAAEPAIWPARSPCAILD